MFSRNPRNFQKGWLRQPFENFLGLKEAQSARPKKPQNPESYGARAACATSFWVLRAT